MKVIGVLSDTHLATVTKEFRDVFTNGPFRDLDTFIHAGDFTSINIETYLDNYLFYGVQGNMDGMMVRKMLPVKRIEMIDGIRIGITHGWGAPFNLDQKVYEFFNDPALDCIVFGHSHNPTHHIIGKTLMFNPGSFKHSLISPHRTIGRLLIDQGKIRSEIITL